MEPNTKKCPDIHSSSLHFFGRKFFLNLSLERCLISGSLLVPTSKRPELLLLWDNQHLTPRAAMEVGYLYTCCPPWAVPRGTVL